MILAAASWHEHRAFGANSDKALRHFEVLRSLTLNTDSVKTLGYCHSAIKATYITPLISRIRRTPGRNAHRRRRLLPLKFALQALFQLR